MKDEQKPKKHLFHWNYLQELKYINRYNKLMIFQYRKIEYGCQMNV